MQNIGRDNNRRVHERLPLRVAVRGTHADQTIAGRSEDMSIGGAKIRWSGEATPDVGEEIDVAVDLPGGTEPLTTRAQVRWRGREGTCGIAFDKRAQAVLAAFFAGLCGLSSATAHANCSVPTFDPNADVVIKDTGSERPDEYAIELAFKRQDAALDKCVKKTKVKIEGKARMEVLLNPDGAQPLGINAKLPRKLRGNAKLTDCLRGATAAAPFPSYDGPPVVAHLDFEIDPGFDVEEDW